MNYSDGSEDGRNPMDVLSLSFVHSSIDDPFCTRDLCNNTKYIPLSCFQLHQISEISFRQYRESFLLSLRQSPTITTETIRRTFVSNRYPPFYTSYLNISCFCTSRDKLAFAPWPNGKYLDYRTIGISESPSE